MVANRKETVGYDEETVAFNKAVAHLKQKYRLFYKEISEQIGLDEKQGEQIRAGKRRANNDNIVNLVKFYPETLKFFPNFEALKNEYLKLRADEKKDLLPKESQLREPNEQVLYEIQPSPWQQLADERKRLLAKQDEDLAKKDEELADLRSRVQRLEMEKELLTKTIEGILSPKK